MPRFVRMLPVLLCIAAAAMLAGCGFHLRRSAVLPEVMQQQVYLQVNGGGEFARSLAGALRASKVNVLDESTKGVATLLVPEAGFSSRMLTSGAVQRVGEYVVGMRVRFSVIDGDGRTVIPTQSLELSHEFAIDSTQFSAISSETEAIERSLVREMTDAVMRRLEAQAQLGTRVVPAGGGSVGTPAAAGGIASPPTPATADSTD